MATIPVRPAKRGIPWWLWLLIALAVAAVVAFFLLSGDADEGDRLDADTTEVGATMPPARTEADLHRLPTSSAPIASGQGVFTDPV